jgi:hypothetical protein
MIEGPMDGWYEEEDDRAGEGPGNLRRYYSPHRAEQLQKLARVASAFCVLSAFLVVPALISFPLGITVWILAALDLVKMRAGEMDPKGESDTKRARDHALLCVVASIPIPCCLGIPSAFALIQLAAKLR